MRWIDDEKQLKKSFFLVCAKMSSNRGMTAFSPVERPPVGRRQVDLEVAGMQHDADRRVDRQSDAVHQRVGYTDGHDAERAQRKAAAGSDLDQLRVVQQAVLFELAFDIRQGELGAVDRHVQLGEDPRQATDVVLVAVGQHDPAHLATVLNQVGDVRYDDVDAQQLFFGEHQTGVHDKDVVAEPKCQTIHAELTESA